MHLPSLGKPGFAGDAALVVVFTLVLMAIANTIAKPSTPIPPPAQGA